jgi:hypothetical protein
MEHDEKPDTEQGYLLVAVLTAEGIQVQTHEVTTYLCGNCEKLHLTWLEGNFRHLADCDPKNVGKAFIQEASTDRVEARLLQMKVCNETRAIPVFRAVFAEYLELIDSHISQMTKALIL